MKFNGEYKRVIGGQERTFKFGLNTLRLVHSRTSQKQLESSILELMAHIFWAGLLVREEENQLPEDFSVETVCDWMEEIGPEAVAEIWTEARKCMNFVPNVLALLSQGNQLNQETT